MSSLPASAIIFSVLIHTLWGGNVVAGKIGLEVFPPFYGAAVRFVFGVATIWCWCAFRKIRLWPEADEWIPILHIAISFTMQIALMNVGFDNTSGSNAAILISTNPLFAVVFAHYLIGGDRLNPGRVFALLVAFAGVVLILHYSNTASDAEFSFGNSGDWLCLASACLLGHRLIASANVMRRVDSYRLAFWQMVFSLPAFILLGILFESVELSSITYRALLGLAYQGIVVAGVGFMVSLWLISRYRPSLMASFNFIAPVSGVLLSILLLGEPYSVYITLSVVLVAVGMILLTLASRPAQKE